MGATTYVPRADVGDSLALPYPEYTDPASGPDDIKDLADAIDAKMTRILHSYRSDDMNWKVIPKAVDYTMNSYTIPVFTSGWGSVHYGVTLTDGDHDVSNQAGSNWAGYVKGYYNNVLFVNRRFHSRDRVMLMEVEIHDEVTIPKWFPTSIVVRFDVLFDSGSNMGNGAFSISRFAFSQFGHEKSV